MAWYFMYYYAHTTLNTTSYCTLYIIIYYHVIGRTARGTNSQGRALLFLLPVRLIHLHTHIYYIKHAYKYVCILHETHVLCMSLHTPPTTALPLHNPYTIYYSNSYTPIPILIHLYNLCIPMYILHVPI